MHCRCFFAKTCPAFCDPRTVAQQAPLSVGFYRQEYWGGLPFSSPGDLPNPDIEPASPALASIGGFFTTRPPGKPICIATKPKSRCSLLERQFVRDQC